MNNTLEVDIIRTKAEPVLAEMSVVPILQEEQFRELAENVQDVFWLICYYEHKTLYISPAYEAIWGRPCKEIYQDPYSWVETIYPEDREAVLGFIAEYREGKHTDIEYRILRPDGSIRWIWNRAFPIYNKLGEVYRTVIIAEDITKRKNAEAQIKASLAQKEILLKEIYHRVKNNMQLISSLLELQTQSIDDPKTIALFQDSQSRIRSMALIHEQLYQSKDLDKIDFSKYVQSLVANLFQSFKVASNRVEVNFNITGNIFLNLETAIPCGLIINELVYNSLKYAFPSDRNGKIRIEFGELNPDQLYLSIRDDGVGLPPNFDVENTESLGLKLVRILTRQLKGVLEINRQTGVEFNIIFGKLNYSQRY